MKEICTKEINQKKEKLTKNRKKKTLTKENSKKERNLKRTMNLGSLRNLSRKIILLTN